MSEYQVAYFVGSLSSTSINRKLSQALIKLAPEDFKFTEVPIGNLPLYSPDFDSDYPRRHRPSRTRLLLRTQSCSSLPSTTGRFQER